MTLTREAMLMKLRSAKTKAPAAWRLIVVAIDKDGPGFSYRLDRDKLRRVRGREGRNLLRTTLSESNPVKLWSYYLQLVQVEEAFRTLKGDLAIRPIHHQRASRVEAHVFIAGPAASENLRRASRRRRADVVKTYGGVA